ncbi:ABC transporter ATP-binding protein [Bacillus dakarensis]|uniref:ABC transporter ATP-binding protein n=1 Tax=Robertmurraya dakarensis TaxID=1926278 RepID=UPI000A00DF14|nr:ABC transporter ATP-binding protein [Bacillus dakarensis]
MKDTTNKIIMLFSKREKYKLLLLFFLMIFAALFETVGIGLIVPFVGIVTDPTIIENQTSLQYIYNLLNFNSHKGFVTFSVVILLAVFILKNLYILFFQYAQGRVIYNQQVKLSQRLFKKYLTKPYSFHLQRNTATLLRNVSREVPKVFNGIIMAGFHLLTEILIIIFIVLLLIVTEPFLTLIVASVLGGSLFLFLRIFRKRVKELGAEQTEFNSDLIKWVNQGLGASKEVKVSGKEDFFVDAYTKPNVLLAKNGIYMRMLDLAPRLFIETIVVSIVLITMLIIIFQNVNTSNLVSTMALFAMAAFRLMPSISRVIGLINSIRYNQPALSAVYEDLFMDNELCENSEPNLNSTFKQEESNLPKRMFKEEIRLKNVSFRYPNQKNLVVKDISLTIPIGQSVAFIGESGAGKTTIVDIILGLFRPEEGSVTVDGKDLFEQIPLWQKKIGYIPQTIYLSDDTIRGNVAFGINKKEIDDAVVWKALEQAQLKEYVESLPDKLETTVGERGVRISGGQRQRIGIARALYHNPEILFMDEATSALDNGTEQEIMKAINGLKGEKTLIIIAHRLSTIQNCDVVFKINNGRLMSKSKKNLEQSVM